MTQLGIDTTNPAGLPPGLNPAYVMGYVDGNWPSYTAIAQMYPSAIPVSITAIPGSAPSLDAQMSDGEEGDYNPVQQAQWAMARWALGYVPALYCSYAEWPQRAQAVIDIGLNPALVDWGIAAYPGIGPLLYSGSFGHQWIDRGPYDEWVIMDGWVPGRARAIPAEGTTADMDDLTYIRWCYYTFLLRDPDTTGFASWADFLSKGGSRNDMMAAFIDSQEGKNVLAGKRKAFGLS